MLQYAAKTSFFKILSTKLRLQKTTSVNLLREEDKSGRQEILEIANHLYVSKQMRKPKWFISFFFVLE